MFDKIKSLGSSVADKMTQRANTLFTSMKDKKTDEEKKKRGLGFSIFDRDKEKPKEIEQKAYDKAKTTIDKEKEIEEKDITEKKIEKNEKTNINNNTTFSDETIKKAREFIGNSEGIKLDAYQDGGGVWTIGYGHTKNVKQGDRITKEEAEKLYKEDFEEHIKPLKEVKVPLTDNQKVALSSFIYNVGGTAFKNSTMLKKLNNNDFEGAANEFDKWIYDNGKKENGLINRRKKEKMLFLQK